MYVRMYIAHCVNLIGLIRYDVIFERWGCVSVWPQGIVVSTLSNFRSESECMRRRLFPVRYSTFGQRLSRPRPHLRRCYNGVHLTCRKIHVNYFSPPTPSPPVTKSNENVRTYSGCFLVSISGGAEGMDGIIPVICIWYSLNASVVVIASPHPHPPSTPLHRHQSPPTVIIITFSIIPSHSAPGCHTTSTRPRACWAFSCFRCTQSYVLLSCDRLGAALLLRPHLRTKTDVKQHHSKRKFFFTIITSFAACNVKN